MELTYLAFFPVSLSFLKSAVFLLTTVFFTWLLPAVFRRKAKSKALQKIPGPPAKPILGSVKLKEMTPKEQFAGLHGNTMLWGESSHKPVIFWLGPRPVLFLTSAKSVEPLVTSNTELLKSDEYRYLKRFLGDGLVTSTGAKWFSHRRLITPAFHFKILEDFAVVMNQNSQKLVKHLESKADGSTIDIFKYVKLCALDIICESAMGYSVNALENENSDYVKAVERFGYVVPLRQRKPWLAVEFIYKLSQYYRNELEDVEVIRSFTRKVLEEKKSKVIDNEENANISEDIYANGGKRKLAFLDLIMSSKKQDGSSLTNEELEDEVSTFMFAGHDTTTAGISWSLLLLGLHPEIQERCYEEIREVAGDDTYLTSTHLRNLKYLECCIKESQRIYPSVPIIGRKLKNDMTVDGFHVPAGVSLAVFTYGLHRDERVWSDPERFDPDRFKTENLSNKHPYAYLPFSAGPRNCIGQKFAMLEEKIMLSTILRNYKVESVDRRDTIEYAGLIVLQPLNGVHIRLTKRT